MSNSLSITTTSANRAMRATGAMFFSGFGGAWLALWVYKLFGFMPIPMAVIAALTALLLFYAHRVYRLHEAALKSEAESPKRKAANRIFNIINIAQWVLVSVLGIGMANVGLSSWFIPAVILVIGLHFLPLAHVFEYRPHYVTGFALIVLALAYPQFALGGPEDPVGCLGTGLILWSSAIGGLVTPSRLP